MIKKLILSVLLLSIFCSGGGSVFAGSYESLPDVVRVEGVVVNDGEVLCTAEVIEHSTVDQFQNFSKNYTAKLLDEGGSVLIEKKFPLMDQEFYFNMPYDESADKLLIFSEDGDEVCSVERSDHDPVVEITSPTGSETFEDVQKITWEMNDADKDDWLLSNVYVAGNDGWGWSMVGYQIEDSFLVLDDSIDATRVMVVVSDGFNSSSAIVEGGKAEGGVFDDVEYEVEQTYSYADAAEEHLSASDLKYEVVTTRGDVGELVIRISLNWDTVVGIVMVIFFLFMVFFVVKKEYGLAVVALIVIIGGLGWFGYKLMSDVFTEEVSNFSSDFGEVDDEEKDLDDNFYFEEDSGEVSIEDQQADSSDFAILDVTASSELMKSNPDYDYSPANIVDEDYDTAWIAEGTLNDWIQIDLKGTESIDTLLIFPGYAQTSDLYYMNNRLKEISVEFSDGSTEILSFSDLFEPSVFTFDSHDTSYVKIKILDVYEGQNNNTCIAEIGFDSMEP